MGGLKQDFPFLRLNIKLFIASTEKETARETLLILAKSREGNKAKLSCGIPGESLIYLSR